MIYAVITTWLACGILAAGLTVGDFIQMFPRLDCVRTRKADRRFGLIFGLCTGPILLFVWVVLHEHKPWWTLSIKDAPAQDWYKKNYNID